jgi:ABC-type cobalamin/Fe3+-siderophores transport system ATPase subunit
VTLAAQSVVCGYRDRTVLHEVSVTLREGELLALVGPNGAGKSTLLRCLHGALRPRSGRVLLGGRDLRTCSSREVARVVGVVPQSSSPAFPVSVASFVGMGRFARERFLGGPTVEDQRVVARCLAEMGLEPLAERAVDELSGGEFRRVLIAQALAQEPSILLFDEPVQQLDLRHQLEVMQFARSFTRRGGTSGAVVLHDLGLAARWCDAIALLLDGRIVAEGRPEEVLTPENLRRAYGVLADVHRNAATGALEVVAVAPAAPAAAGGDRAERAVFVEASDERRSR